MSIWLISLFLTTHLVFPYKFTHSSAIPTPVVLIVVEGGVNTMETAFQACKRNTPVVVINGSGRAADIIALAFKITADPAK